MSVPMCSQVVPKEASGLAVSVSILRLYVWTETMQAPIDESQYLCYAAEDLVRLRAADL